MAAHYTRSMRVRREGPLLEDALRVEARSRDPEALVPLLLGSSLLSARDLGGVYEDALAHAGNRRRQGSYYTPAPVVRMLAELTLRPRMHAIVESRFE